MWKYQSKFVWEHFLANSNYFKYGPWLLFSYQIFLKTGVCCNYIQYKWWVGMMMLSIHKLYVLVRAVNQFCVLICLVVCLDNEMYVFWTIQFLIRNEQQNLSFERVAEDNTRWVWCTSIHHTHTYKVLIMLRFLLRL